MKNLFNAFKMFDEDLASVSTKKRSFLWKKPTILNSTILDWVKYRMYQFHNDVMKNHFNCRFLCSDTESLLCELKVKDLYNELYTTSNLRLHFHLPNYTKDHYLYNIDNGMVALKINDVSRPPYRRIFWTEA